MRILLCAAVAVAFVAGACGSALADPLAIDVPVKLEKAEIVLNIDRPAFEGDEPTGIKFMKVMIEKFASDDTESRIVAIFHGEMGYMLLADDTYDRVRKWQGGNPYKEQIAALMAKGVEIEECGQTMRDEGWSNADLMPGVKVNSGANFRIVELVQEGFVQIQP